MTSVLPAETRAAIDEYVAELLAKTPPLPPEACDQIVAMLRPYAPRAGAA